MMRILLAALLLVTVSAGVAHGEPRASRKKRARAEKLYEEAVRHYNVGDYDLAIVRFKESYVLFPAPLLLFNVAQAYRLKGDCPQALRSYRAYLREEPDPPNKDKVTEAIRICEEKKPAPVEPEPSPPVEPKPASTETRSLPPARPVTAAPIAKRSAPHTRPGSGRGMRVVGLSVAAAGLAAAGTGAWLGMRAASDAEAIDSFDGEWNRSWEEREARQRRDATLGPALLAAGGAAVAGGVILYLVGRRHGRAEIAATPTDGGAGVVLSGRF
jgi:tetratricopeptide (TPR) repeat protein